MSSISIHKEIMQNEKKIELQLGDVIQILDSSNERIHEETFIIEYLDPQLLLLTNIDNFDQIRLPISEEGVLGNGSIESILLLSRDEKKGYAKQNHLEPGTWINIHFGGDVPSILTGEITNLEEDMIEITTYPEGDVIYINFEYQGIPLDLPIDSIEIREKPEKPLLVSYQEEDDEGYKVVEKEEKEVPVEKIPIPTFRNQIREMILKADQIQFGNEEFGPIVQYTNVDASKQRFSIDVQTSDLLDELLSTIPNTKRTHSVLNNIHTMIERFKQLRQLFSHFDEYGNVTEAFVRRANYKPLEQYFKSFQQNLYWILPVVKNIKKIYSFYNDILSNETNDTVLIDSNEDIEQMISNVDTYRSNTMNEEQNKYSILYQELNPYFTPFEYISPENQESIILEKSVETNIHTIIDNLSDLYSSVYSGNQILSKRFLIQKYNLGLNQLENTVSNKNQTVAIRVPLTQPDTMSIHSFITLPEPVIQYSRIQLPGTNILDRAVLNQTSLNYWLLFKKTSKIQSILVDQELDFNENNFANQIKEFILGTGDTNSRLSKETSKKELYDEFINSIVPKTKVLFQYIKKYIHGKLSVVELVQSLEPFLIYSDDLTYMQYNDMTKFIDEKISEFNKSFLEKEREFSKFKRRKDYPSFQKDVFTLTQLLNDSTNNSTNNNANTSYRDEIMNDYEIVETKDNYLSDSEILRKILVKDQGRLFSIVLAIQNLPLMFPLNLQELLEQEKKNEKGIQESTNECKKYVVSKWYTSEEELKMDNDKDTYFDKKYDQTNYGILDEYEKEMFSKSPEEFIVFLTEKVGKRYRLNEKEAEFLAETLIGGMKRVRGGDYAIVYHNVENSPSFTYYIRKDNQWIKDDSADQKFLQSANSDDSGILCDLQPSCVQVVDKYGEKCESLEMNKLQLKQEILNQVMDEFDEKYAVSKQALEEKIRKQYDYYSTIWFPKLSLIEREQMLKYNNKRYEMGLQSEDEKPIIQSPYAPIRDIILGQQDFVKKQNDIIKFVELFSRKAISNSIGASGDKESEHWLYCVKTNIELLPIFYYDLACAFMNTPDQYYQYLQQLVAKIGALSDDEKAWTDKYTGREICKIDYSFDEGFNEGFKVSTRAILEEDAGNRVLVSSHKNTYDTVEMKVVSNIVNAISVAMGINIESQKDFIISGVLESLKTHLEKEETYKKRVKEMANRGTNIPSYQDLYNATLLFFSLGMFLIALQTSIPSVRTRKTFPGCVRSFSGYPFQGSDDLSSLNYLACVVYAIRKNTADPWTVIKNTKETAIANKIKTSIELLLQFPMVKNKIDEKTAYLLVNQDYIEIPVEHDVSLWKEFLPPLVSFRIKNLNNISPEFENKLLSDLKMGNPNQREKILIVQSKSFLFSLAIQEKIQEIVSKKDALLNKANREPYLENACCDEKSVETFIEYFEKIDPNISQYNKIVHNLSNILMDIRHYSEAQIFYSNINTKNIYPPLNQAFDEKTIYLGFIRFCRFNSLLPMDDDLLPLCSDKPTYLNNNESLNEMISKLKNDGRDYTEKMFLRLLQVISRKNILSIDFNDSLPSSLHRLTDTLEMIEGQNDEVVEKSLRVLIMNTLDTFDIATNQITDETKSLNNFLIKHTESMKKEIMDFIIQNKGVDTQKEERMLTSFLSNFSEWNIMKDVDSKNNKVSNDPIYTMTNFYKNMIQDIVLTFPNIILNQVDYSNIKIPDYWGLSQRHANDIKRSISDFYQYLRNFYEDPSLIHLLKMVQQTSKNFVSLAKETPCFSSIHYKDQTLKPIFDERTSQYLFEYYLLRIFVHYIDLSEDEANIVTQEISKPQEVEDLFTVEYLDEKERRVNVDVTDYDERDIVLLRGNVKALKNKTAKILISYIKIMSQYKDRIDISYQDIQDRNFKLKEKEKVIITDRLEGITDEERDADTILKINKLGVWSKGLQKGLTSYLKEDYDDQREFMETMMQYEKKVTTKKVTLEEFHDFRDDYLEEIQEEEDIEREAYDMSHMTEDYMDGNEYEGNEVDDYEDYN